QSSAIDNQLDAVVEHMRHRFRQMLAVLKSALAHDVEEQHGALSRIDQVLHGRGEERGRRTVRDRRLVKGHAWNLLLCELAAEDDGPFERTLDLSQGRLRQSPLSQNVQNSAGTRSVDFATSPAGSSRIHAIISSQATARMIGPMNRPTIPLAN